MAGIASEVRSQLSGLQVLKPSSGVSGSDPADLGGPPSSHDFQAAGEAPLSPQAPAATPPPPHLICPQPTGRTPARTTTFHHSELYRSARACGTSWQWFAGAGFCLFDWQSGAWWFRMENLLPMPGNCVFTFSELYIFVYMDF